jgi:hypothetical protein
VSIFVRKGIGKVMWMPTNLFFRSIMPAAGEKFPSLPPSSQGPGVSHRIKTCSEAFVFSRRSTLEFIFLTLVALIEKEKTDTVEVKLAICDKAC